MLQSELFRCIALLGLQMEVHQLSFLGQIQIIERNHTPKLIILGDFNLDAKMQFRLDYPHKHIYNYLNDFTSKFNFNQVVDFPTWSRTINNIKKESILDHVYSNDITTLNKCHFFTPNFGDHLVVVADVQTTLNPVKERVVRNWHNYQPEKLISTLFDFLALL